MRLAAFRTKPQPLVCASPLHDHARRGRSYFQLGLWSRCTRTLLTPLARRLQLAEHRSSTELRAQPEVSIGALGMTAHQISRRIVGASEFDAFDAIYVQETRRRHAIRGRGIGRGEEAVSKPRRTERDS
jgi:hypothetical protein